MWPHFWHSARSMSFGVEGEAEGGQLARGFLEARVHGIGLNVNAVSIGTRNVQKHLPRRALDGLETPYLAMRRSVVQDLQARAYFNHQWLISLAHENLLDSCGKFCAQPDKTPAFLILTDDDFPRSNARKVLKS
jgi:hypothetical protein